MKRTLRIVTLVGLLAWVVFATIPASAHVAPASDLQVQVTGASGVLAGNPGCTRVTNRFCVQGSRSNCFACP